MKLRRKIAILLALLLLASLPLFATAVADLGDFSGGGDYGGSGSSSSDDCDGIGWLIYYVLRIGCTIGEAAEKAGCSHGQVIVFEIVFFAAVIGLFVLIVRLRSRAAHKSERNAPAVQVPTPGFTTVETDQGVFARIHAVDPEFSEQDLLEKLKNLYFRFVDCRQNGDLSPIRPYLTDALYAKTEAALAACREAHVTEHTERLAILDARLNGFVQGNGRDMITATLSTRCVRYLQSDGAGSDAGKKAAECFEMVTIVLERPTGVKTAPREAGRSVKNCPFCGAPLSLNESNQCPYCDSVLPAAPDEWIIRSITAR